MHLAIGFTTLAENLPTPWHPGALRPHSIRYWLREVEVLNLPGILEVAECLSSTCLPGPKGKGYKNIEAQAKTCGFFITKACIQSLF